MLNLGLTSNKPTHYLLDYGDLVSNNAWKWEGIIATSTCYPEGLNFSNESLLSHADYYLPQPN